MKKFRRKVKEKSQQEIQERGANCRENSRECPKVIIKTRIHMIHNKY